MRPRHVGPTRVELFRKAFRALRSWSGACDLTYAEAFRSVAPDRTTYGSLRTRFDGPEGQELHAIRAATMVAPAVDRRKVDADRADGVFLNVDLSWRCVLLARILASGDFDGVAVADRGWVRDALADTYGPWSTSGWPPPPETPEAPGPVAFSFARMVTVAGHGRAVRAVGAVEVTDIPARDAPIACLLATPGGAPPLPVRRWDDVWLRPVLAPGSWEHASLATFVRAALEAPPWVDSPFVARPARGGVMWGLRDYAVDHDARGADLARSEERAARLAAACGPLLLVDGVVHRTTTRPSLMIAERRLAQALGPISPHGPEDGHVLTWRLGCGLDGLAVQVPVRRTHWDVAWDHEVGSRPGVSFGAGDVAAALAYFEVRRRTERGRKVRWIDGPPPVDDVDTALLPPSDTPCLDVLARWDEGAVGAREAARSGDLARACRAVRDGVGGSGAVDLAFDVYVASHGGARCDAAVAALASLAVIEADGIDPEAAAGFPGFVP